MAKSQTQTTGPRTEQVKESVANMNNGTVYICTEEQSYIICRKVYTDGDNHMKWTKTASKDKYAFFNLWFLDFM